MPWKGVTVSEQRENFLLDHGLRYYRLVELADMYSISRKTAYKWIDRYEEMGRSGLEDLSRRPHSCPWQTPTFIREELVKLRGVHPYWGPKKLLDVLERRHRKCPLCQHRCRLKGGDIEVQHRVPNFSSQEGFAA